MSANARVHVLRGTYRDELGDEVDAWDVDAVDETQRPVVVTPIGGEAATIIERSRIVFDPSTGEQRTVQVLTGRMLGRTVPAVGDRLVDLATGARYGVSGVPVTTRSIGGRRTVRFDLRRMPGA